MEGRSHAICVQETFLWPASPPKRLTPCRQLLETLASGCRRAAHEESASRIEELEGGCGSRELVLVISSSGSAVPLTSTTST